MRKKLFLLLIPLFFFTASCSLNVLQPEGDNNTDTPSKDDSKVYTVTFVSNNGTEDISVAVAAGSDTYEKPEAPQKTGYIFDCWCMDEELTMEFDFSTDITESITLYARYYTDYAYLTNQITTDTIRANITVINSSYSGTFFPTLNSQSTGSGIIFDFKVIGKKNYYFALTNNHVIYSTAANVKYTVEDYLGNTYTASLIAADAGYDLAIIAFEKSIDLTVIEAVENNPKINSEIVSLGQPKGQSNAITYGTIQAYKAISLSEAHPEESNILFDTISHTSYIASGSSGGALLNTELKLVGINFAGATTANGVFVSGHAVPIEKVREFVLSADLTI